MKSSPISIRELAGSKSSIINVVQLSKQKKAGYKHGKKESGQKGTGRY